MILVIKFLLYKEHWCNEIVLKTAGHEDLKHCFRYLKF